MNRVPPVDPISKTLQDLLNAASALVGRPPLTAVRVTPQSLAAARGAADLHRLLDDVLARHDELVILADRLHEAGRRRRLPAPLVLAVTHTTAGCLEATRGLADHLRARVNDELGRCFGEVA